MTDNDRGIFISLEGDEYTGKTTNAQLLVEALKLIGVDAGYTREPGGSQRAEQIRENLKSGKPEGMSDENWTVLEAGMFYTARGYSYEDVVDPLLNRNPKKVLITDRSHDSTWVYQGEIGAGLCPTQVLEQLHRDHVGDRGPDKTFYMSIDNETYQFRWNHDQKDGGRGEDAISRFDTDDREFHGKLRAGYENLVEREPERFEVVDARETPRQVFTNLWNSTLDYLASRGVLDVGLDTAKARIEEVFCLESFKSFEACAIEP